MRTSTGLWCSDRRRGVFVLDVEQVLAVCGQGPVLSEVRVTRDPEGPDEVTVAVLGEPVTGEQVQVFGVDAGARWADWVGRRDECLSRAREGIREPLRGIRPGLHTARRVSTAPRRHTDFEQAMGVQGGGAR